ncbi:MAG: NifU family protein [Acholeplasmatales bacterium]|jgi:Fe-S cluster biogenesis protein NfuA|nr:NifU family protein [Acholeplasmatales bacterium]MBQ6783164.1 NifU family protein [Acholeplasmatales bacterium]MBR6288017.1 NifU family protein [Acholeplasmatales bacterium]
MEENKNKNSETIKEIHRVLDKLRPYLNSEGGDIQFIDYEDGIVYVRMLGACVGCGSLDYTLKEGIEALLVEYVPDVIEVRNVEEEEEM